MQEFPPPENSSSSSVQERNYCVYLEMQFCVYGIYSECPSGGFLGKECPFAGSSSSSAGGSLSSSQGQSQFDGDEFIDARDGKRYKFETAPNGRVWMSENINFSKGETLGWCYGTGNNLGTSAEGSGCGRPNGRTYTYAMTIDESLCPGGWHIPSVAEWLAIGAVQGQTGGTRVMSSGFYVYAGNFNTNPGTP